MLKSQIEFLTSSAVQVVMLFGKTGTVNTPSEVDAVRALRGSAKSRLVFCLRSLAVDKPGGIGSDA